MKHKIRPERRGAADELLTTRQASNRLKISASQLNKWRLTGGGPMFVRFGRAVRYEPLALTHFIEKHRKNPSAVNRYDTP